VQVDADATRAHFGGGGGGGGLAKSRLVSPFSDPGGSTYWLPIVTGSNTLTPWCQFRAVADRTPHLKLYRTRPPFHLLTAILTFLD
jgi:hypothetical protein